MVPFRGGLPHVPDGVHGLDLAYAVGAMSKYVEALSPDFFAAVKRILRYVRGTSDYALHLGSSETPPRLYGYYDAQGHRALTTACPSWDTCSSWEMEQFLGVTRSSHLFPCQLLKRSTWRCPTHVGRRYG